MHLAVGGRYLAYPGPGTGPFGDAAATAIIAGAKRELPGPEIVGTRSVFVPNAEDVIGWGFRRRALGSFSRGACPILFACARLMYSETGNLSSASMLVVLD